MAFKWFKKKEQNYPEFWKQYLSYFNSSKNNTIDNSRYVAFDTETTGFDTDRDRVLSIGAVMLQNNTISVDDSFEAYINQDIFKAETVKIHGILKHGDLEKVSELEAIEAFLNYVKGDVLIGHHTRFDIEMMNSMLQRNGLGKLKNEFIDTATLFKKSKHIIYQDNLKNYSLDELAKELNVPIVDRHTANGDALITAIVYLKILSRLKNNKSDLQWDYLLNT